MGSMSQDYFKYFSIAFFLLIIFLAYLLIKPYLIAIFSSFLLAYFFYPAYRIFNRIIKNKSIASLALITLIILIIIIPAFFFFNILIEQSSDVFRNVKNIDIDFISGYLSFGDLNLNQYAREISSKGLSLILNSLSDFVFTIPGRILNIFIIIFLLYYLFKDGNNLVLKIREKIPLKNQDKEIVFSHVKEVLDATLYGIVLTAIIQGIVGMIGLFIFKVSSPILFGLLIIVASMIPYLGSALVWLPISAYKIFIGDYFNGFGLLLYGTLIIGMIDNFVRPMIIGRKARIHPAVTLLGVIGGLSLFGFPGMMLGPVLIAVSLALIEIFLVELE